MKMADMPPPMHPNRIDAAYADMRNKGQFYVPQLAGPPLTIQQWRDNELVRWHLHMDNQLAGLDK
jgi:hypothetical protein